MTAKESVWELQNQQQVNSLSENITRYEVPSVLRYELDETKETGKSIDWLQGIWEAQGEIISRFDQRVAQKIVAAPTSRI